MAPEDTQVSAPVTSGNSELSAPGISGEQGGQPESAGQKEELDLAKEFQDIKARLEKFERGEQSVKDRGVRKLETRLDDLTKALAFLDKLDGTATERVVPQPENSPQVSKDKELEADYKRRVTKHLNKLGIPEAEHGMATAALAGKEFADWDEAVDEAMIAGRTYLENRKKQTAPASVAGVSTQAKGSSSHEDTEEETADEVNKLVQSGNLRDPKTRARLKELREKMEKKNPLDRSVT